MKSHYSHASLRRFGLPSLLLTLQCASALTAGCGDDFPRAEETDSLPEGDVTQDTALEDGADAAPDTADGATTDVEAPDVADSSDGDSDASTDSDAGTDSDAADTQPGCDGEPGCSCQDAKECKSEICGLTKDGTGVCFDGCESDIDCGADSRCKVVPFTPKKACVPKGLFDGTPCANEQLCGLSDMVCTSYGHEGSFCAEPCKADADCATGKCVDAKDLTGAAIKACKGDTAPACTGVAVALGATTSCYSKDLPGCSAPRKCSAKDGKLGPQGEYSLDACAPTAPSAETCDGLDQDCDGTPDNGAACNDGNPCTDDSCQSGACAHAPNSAACDDGDACTEADKCDGKGKCAATAKSCEDGNVCTDNACDPKTGCALPVNTTKTCDDGDACTEADQCDGGGKCTASAKSCEDGNSCTDNPCDPKTGCGLPVSTTKTCDDGDACTEADQCDGIGKCLSKPKSCEDGNTCTDNPCDPKTGCGLPVNTTKTCDDGDACTEADQCDGGGKCASKPKSCEDGNTCTDNPCDPKTGCGAAVNTTKTCDDGDACTEKDVCDGKGKCTASAKSCEDGNTCTDNPCDPKTGCALPVNTTKTCDDGDACTVKDQCDGKGKCGASTLSCEDGNACTDDPCDSKTGCAAKVNSTKVCNDGDACSEKDQCDGKGACKAQKVSCEDGNPCTDDPCDSKTGCAAKINTTKPCTDLPNCKAGGTCDGGGKCAGLKDSCDDSNSCTADSCKGGGAGCANVPGNEGGSCTDGDACTDSDVCAKGACTGKKKLCEDANICTDDACKDGTCVALPNTGTGCEDGAKCTSKDACKDGVCLGGAGVCEDGLPCTDDPCDAQTGACGFKVLNTKPCDDGLPCTTGSLCDGKGACKGGTATVCDDKNPCTVDSCDVTKGCVAKAVAAASPCSDGKPCTLGDACDDKGGCVAASDITGKACDDGNACSKDDLCDAVKGCQGAPVADCGSTPFVPPYVETFTCNSPSLKLWAPMLTKPGELGWRVDALPTTPAPYSADCTLNFNNDKDYSTGSAVPKTAIEGPKFDLGGAKLPALRFQLAGVWENDKNFGGALYDQLDVVVTTYVDGKAVVPGKVVATPLSPGKWVLQELDLSAYVGKIISVSFQFSTDDGDFNKTSGPFIDDVALVDLDCAASPAVCDDGNVCTVDGCDKATGKCTKANATGPCQDGQACTEDDACKDGACSAGAAKTCDDGDACTSFETCVEAMKGCVAATVVVCQDFNPCTADSCDKANGTCKHVAITGCAPACKSDGDCASTNPCLSGACQPASGTCKFSAANDGNVCAEGRTCGAGKCAESTVGWARTVHANPDGRFFCAVTVAGKVACWGRNDQGQIGNGNTGTNALTATPVTLPADVTMVAVGADHACALQTDGKVYCWGDNVYGQLGDGKTADSNVPVLASEIADAVSIAAGGDFTCWVTKAATAKCVGYGALGRLGHGSSSNSTTAVDVKDLKDVRRISSLYYNSCALKQDRTVWCWGYNFDRQLVNNATMTQNVPVPRLGASGVYDIDGSYASVSWASMLGAFSVGDNSDGQLGDGTTTDSAVPVGVTGATGVVAVPGGADHHLALTAQGGVWGAGAASSGQLALAQSADQLTYVKLAFAKAIALDASASSTCIVTAKGSVTCSGSNTYGELGNGKTANSNEPVVVHGLCKADDDCDDGVACTTGSCKDGKCAFTAAPDGPCDDGDACTEKDACVSGACAGAPVACSDGNACTLGESCLTLGGKMTCVAGVNKNCDDGKPCTADACEPKNGACIHAPIPSCLIGCKTDVNCNDNHACTADTCAVDTGACTYKASADGGVCGVGSVCTAGSCAPIKGGWAKAIHGSPGADHFCVTTQAGELACFGANSQGQIGNNSTSSQSSPVKVEGPTKVVRVALGSDHTCAQGGQGEVWCWGDNQFNVIHSESTTDALKPVAVKSLTGASDLCAGSDFTCAILAGKAWCLGFNGQGQLGDGTLDNAKAPVAVKLASEPTSLRCGTGSACARTSDGAVWCWGANFDKQVSGTAPSSVPVPVVRSASGTADAVGGAALTHCWALFGKAWCAGDNGSGQLGDGTTTDSGEPLEVKIDAALVKIVGGSANLAALTSAGHIHTIGNNTYGALVDGTSNSRKTWLNVTPVGKTYVDVAMTRFATCALSPAGTIECGGDGFYGQLGNGGTNGQTAFGATLVPCDGDAACDDGSKCTTEVCDGTKKTCTYGAKACDDANLCTIADFCEATTGDCKPGTAKTCDDKNECTADSCDPKTGACGYKAIQGCQISCKSNVDCPEAPDACGSYACVGNSNAKCVLQDKNNGAVCDVGKTCGGGKCASPAKGWAKQLSSFSYFATFVCAAQNDGLVSCWGHNSDGQLGDGSSTNRSQPVLVKNIDKVQQVAAGYRHACAIRDAGKVACWGQNSFGQTGNGIASSTDVMAPVDTGLEGATSVCAGYGHSCAVTQDGSVHCWGRSSQGTLGNGKTSTSSLDYVTKPAKVPGVAGAVEVGCGYDWTCARTSDGDVYCWGDSLFNQTQAASTTDIANATKRSGLASARALSTGSYHGCITTTKGAPWCWGYNTNSVVTADGKTSHVGAPVDLSGALGAVGHIHAGYQNTAAVATDGSLWIWGSNSSGQLLDGGVSNSGTPLKVNGVTGVIQAALGYQFICVLAGDGEVKCGGAGADGQLGNGQTIAQKSLVAVIPPK